MITEDLETDFRLKKKKKSAFYFYRNLEPKMVKRRRQEIGLSKGTWN